MTLEDMLKNRDRLQSVAFSSIGKKFDCDGDIYEAMFITDNGDIVLQAVNSSDKFYAPSVGAWVQKIKNGEYREYRDPEVSA